MVNIRGQLTPCFVVTLVYRATLKVDNAGESVHMVNGSHGGNFGSKSMATDCRHSDFVGVHEPDNIVRHLHEIVGIVVVRFSLVAIIKEPNVANVPDSIAFSVEESREVCSRFEDVTKPDHGWHVLAPRW